jgi:ribonucleoside-diphosphate reductase alpha chain
MNKELLDYFSGDELAANVWESKYQVKDLQNNPLENTPDDMHKRLAKEFARIEKQYILRLESKAHCYNDLSECGKKYYHYGQNLAYDGLLDKVEEDIFNYFKNFKYIIPQGSIMSILGHPYKVGSLSNCFVIPAPLDSYGGILYTDEHLVQLMKRRGGVGTNLNNLRPTKTVVTNSAGSSTGVPSFAERYSNTTREVAQDGRRGALMLLLSVKHPDIFKFVTMKSDRSKITGANVSVQLTDEFMKAVDQDNDFICTFPVDMEVEQIHLDGVEYEDYNKLVKVGEKYGYAMKIEAKKLFDLIVEMAWENAEPGVAFMDRVIDYSPEGVYPQFKPIASNPCGEQWMQAYDACRLMALNFFSVVENPFTKDAKIDYEKLYEISYIQQRLADDLVDLEIEHIEAIINKIHNDPEPENIKEHELDLWINILNTCKAGRRTGCGFTGLGDMLAALGLKYDSEESMKVIDEVMKTKLRAELDCTIDMSILRGSFDGWNPILEFGEFKEINIEPESLIVIDINKLGNKFYQILIQDFQNQTNRMIRYGRRNVSWSTVAPTGTVSLMTQTTSGLEPLFSPYYFRKKKINPNDKESRVDFVDQNGDSWQEFPVLHPKFKDWININFDILGLSGQQDIEEEMSKENLQKAFEKSPWYQSTANDIDWKKRVEIQSIIQKYTTNAISSTINLPNDVTKEEVGKIYHAAYHAGLKGVTVYRDGCRTGVISTETSKVSKDKFGYTEAVKRPKELEADYYYATSKGKKYAVIVGLLDSKPYEIFAFENPVNEEHLKGKIIKIKKGHYSFISPNYTIENLQLSSEHTDERLLTRWVSTLLRHGANPKFVIEQTEKSEVGITNFVKVICRVLKKYVIDGEVSSSKCPECKEGSLIYEEGCKKCNNCGYSAC